MSIFLEIAFHYAVTDAALGADEQAAFQANDDAAFDRAVKSRQRNDQAYFLYLFTRFEAEVNAGVETLLTARTISSAAWTERRVWQAWSRSPVSEISFLSKVEVLTDKARTDFAKAKDYYYGRNTIAHGGDWDARFFVPKVARAMHDIVARFEKT
jgi:hypothetical protein